MAYTTKKSQNNNLLKVVRLLVFGGAIVLLTSGILTWKVHTQIIDMVQSELAAQKIYFPPTGSPAFSAKDFPDIQKYAGQQVDTPEEAEAYANGFIKRHLQKIGGGKVYAEISAATQKDPTNPTLQAQQQALFQGETLRGMLLGNGYAFGIVGKIAKLVAIAQLAGSAVLFASALYLYRSKN